MPDSMIQTVDYETEIAIEAKSTEQLTAEVNVRYRQAESLASMSAAMLADAGRRLIEIKSRMPHGTFGDWCQNNLDFSYRKAGRMMQLAEKMEDENSIFSNSPTLANIGISRVWELLATPEEVAAEVVETENVSEMTIRELKEKLKDAAARMQAAEERAEAAEERADAAELAAVSPDSQELEDLKLSVEHMKASLDEKEAERAQAVTEQGKAKEQLAKAKEKLKALKGEQQGLIDKAIEEKESQIKADAESAVSGKIKRFEEDIRDQQEEIERLNAKVRKAENSDLTTFRVQANIFQSAFNECLGCIGNAEREDDTTAISMRTALRKILETELEALSE